MYQGCPLGAFGVPRPPTEAAAAVGGGSRGRRAHESLTTGSVTAESGAQLHLQAMQAENAPVYLGSRGGTPGPDGRRRRELRLLFPQRSSGSGDHESAAVSASSSLFLQVKKSFDLTQVGSSRAFWVNAVQGLNCSQWFNYSVSLRRSLRPLAQRGNRPLTCSDPAR